MISGAVSGGREAVVRLVLIGAAGQTEEIEAVIDTGFNGFLTLPPALTALLGLPFWINEQAILADGQAVLLPVYRAKVLWNGVTRDVLAMVTGDDPLIGMALLDGHRLTIDAVDGGPVTIEPIG